MSRDIMKKHMPALIIPLLIVLGIVGFSTGGNVIKSIVSSFSDSFQTAPAPFESPQGKPAPTPKSRNQVSPERNLVSPASPAPTLKPVPAPAPVVVQPPSTNSPYFQKIRISSVRPTKDSEPALVTLSASFSDETPVNITGWKLKSQWLGEATLGKGIENLRSALMTEAIDNILVRRSDTLYVRGELSPLGTGRSFRPNQCFGYLIQYYPNLPGSYSCSQDRPTLQDIQYLTPLCQEYILRKMDYSSCKLPDFNDPMVIGNSECRTYLIGTGGAFTYQGCYEKRSKDANFLSNRWDIYIERSFGHPLHDAITLLDQNGLLVDTYIY
jgi:hypothetical protein